MAALKYNLVSGALSGDHTSGVTTITLAAALQEGGVNVPTIVSPDFIRLRIDNEIVHLTAYTAGATTGTISRAQGQTVAAAHVSGAAVRIVPTKDDFVGGAYAAATTDVFATKVTADTNDRFVFNADGSMEWGPGSGATDTTLYRSAADTLKTDDSLVVVGDLTLSASDIITDTTTGTKIGTGTTQKLGFFNATPVVQPTAYTQTFATADKTHAARTSAATATTASTQTTPFGYTTAAQADAIITNLNAVRADLDDTAQVLNALIDDLQALGIIG